MTRSQLSELTPFGSNLDRSTPLWYYILKEVAEVFLGLLSLDSNSYLARNPQWRPTLPGRRRGTFGIVDFLTLAGVDPASRGQ